MTKRKFKRTTVKLVILHEEVTELSDLEIDALHESVTDGPGILVSRDDETEVLDGEQAAKALRKSGSYEEFFNLTPSGNDADAELFQCRTCKDEVTVDEMREHLDAHDDHVYAMSTEQVRDCFEAAS